MRHHHTPPLFLVLLAGCAGERSDRAGSMSADVGLEDAAVDAGASDAGPADAAPDAAPGDARADAAPSDAAPPDAAWACTPGTTSPEPCPRRGVCAGAEATCRDDGTWGPCALPATHEADEATCDGLDNDCDGETDEGFPDRGAPCDGDDADACTLGQWRCNEAGDGLVCADDEPQVEACNALDDDCDGAVDEDVPDPPLAERQAGACAGAVQVCAGEDGWVEPDYAALPGYEAVEAACDGLDNDCDGRVDAGLFAPPASRQAGVCAGLRRICAGEDGWVEPDYGAVEGYEADEATCDGLDNDCDGEIDEALMPPPCRLTEGVCFAPRAPAACDGAAGWSDCDYGPDFEPDEVDTCDALDNDCDGEIDEGAPCPPARRAVRVPAGEYRRGSPPDESGRDDDEAPHLVTLTRPLLARQTEITQDEWRALMDENPSFTPSADRPVEQITWLEAATFANALSRAEGLAPCYEIEGIEVRWPEGPDCEGWRLPTEAEWEYLARGGTEGARWSDAAGLALEEAAWYRDSSEGTTHPVGALAANPFGLYDVLGNVAEWVWDRYGPYPEGPVVDPLGPEEGARRVARGGTFNALPRLLRSANRADFEPTTRLRDLGLRLVRTAPPIPADATPGDAP